MCHRYLWASVRCEPLHDFFLMSFISTQVSPNLPNRERPDSPQNRTPQWMDVLPVSISPFSNLTLVPAFQMTPSKRALFSALGSMHHSSLKPSSSDSYHTLPDFHSRLCWLILDILCSSSSLLHLQMLEFPGLKSWVLVHFMFSSHFHPHPRLQ